MFDPPYVGAINVCFTEKAIIGMPSPNPSHVNSYILPCYYVNAYYLCKYVD